MITLRSRTHNLFSFAISLSISLNLLNLDIFYATIVSIYLSISINQVTDSVLGHKGFKRTPYTHSIFGSTMISVIMAVPMTFLVYLYFPNALINIAIPLVLISIAVGYTHLLLDILTADGVYLLWPLSKKKISLLKVRYDNSTINILITFISIMIIAWILFTRIETYVKGFIP
uniref:Metal-dependent hydrolase n=1 Tax=Ignisphaera aggregans TaxID=334771 RepID=A0A7C4NK18_9CREN